MRIDHLAVVMPAYNEADGIVGFVDELLEHLQPLAHRVTVTVVDDRSTDATAAVLDGLADRDGRVTVVHAERNRGHGPTALAAYAAGLDAGADVVLHVDGDGQFLGEDAARVVAALDDDVDVVHGVRRRRTDPWFRILLTRAVRSLTAAATGRRVSDVNTPLRAYRPAVVAELVERAPREALVPHVHFSLDEARRGLRVREVVVASIPRRGGDATGTMWGASSTPRLPPPRLLRFSRSAAAEVWRHSLRPALTPSVGLAAVVGVLVITGYVIVIARAFELPLWEDEAFNLTVPLNLVRGLGYTSDGVLSFGVPAPFDFRITTGPVMLLPMAGPIALGADPVTAGRGIALLFAIVLVIGCFVLGRRVGGLWGGVAASATPLLLDLGALPSPIQSPIDVLGEVPTAALLVLALLSLRRRPLVSALLFGLAIQVKFIALLVAPVLLVAAIVLAPRGRRVTRGLVFVAVAAAPTVLAELAALFSLGLGGYVERLRLLRWFLKSGGQEGLGVGPAVKVETLATSTALPWFVAAIALLSVVALALRGLRRPAPERVTVLVATAGLGVFLLWWIGSSHLPAWVRHPAPALLAFLPVLVAAAVATLRRMPMRAVAIPAAAALAAIGLWAGVARVVDAATVPSYTTLTEQRAAADRLAQLDAPWITTPWGLGVSLVVLAGAHAGVPVVMPDAPELTVQPRDGCEPLAYGWSVCE